MIDKNYDKEFELAVYKNFTFSVAGLIEELLNKIDLLEVELNECKRFK